MNRGIPSPSYHHSEFGRIGYSPGSCARSGARDPGTHSLLQGALSPCPLPSYALQRPQQPGTGRKGDRRGRESASGRNPSPSDRLGPAQSPPDSFWLPGPGDRSSNSSHSSKWERAHCFIASPATAESPLRRWRKQSPAQTWRVSSTTWAEDRPTKSCLGATLLTTPSSLSLWWSFLGSARQEEGLPIAPLLGCCPGGRIYLEPSYLVSY